MQFIQQELLWQPTLVASDTRDHFHFFMLHKTLLVGHFLKSDSALALPFKVTFERSSLAEQRKDAAWIMRDELFAKALQAVPLLAFCAADVSHEEDSYMTWNNSVSATA